MVTMQELLEAGAHFGHKTSRRNPAFMPFIHGERNGIHIINAAYTLMQLERSAEFVQGVVAGGGKVLFAGTKAQASEIVEREAERCGQFYVTFRWLGGLLTNFKTVRSSIQRMTVLEEGEEGSNITLTKKEQLSRSREFLKLHRVLKGVREMRKAPDVVIVVDLNHEEIAVHECKVLNIPVVGIVDTNSDPTSVAYPIPGNDDAVRAIELYLKVLADACIEGTRMFEEKAQQVEDTVEETELVLDREEDLDEAALLSRRKVYKVKKTIRGGKETGESGEKSAADTKGSEATEAVAVADAAAADAGVPAEAAPVKEELQKKKKSPPKKSVSGNTPVEASDTAAPKAAAKTPVVKKVAKEDKKDKVAEKKAEAAPAKEEEGK